MLKLLSKFFGTDLTAPSEPIVRISDKEIIKELRTQYPSTPSKKKEMEKFLLYITPRLNKTESQRLIRRTTRLLSKFDPIDALGNGFMGFDNGQRRGQWVFIQLDAKAEEEIDWQVSEILSLYNIKNDWDHDSKKTPLGTYNALHELSKWLSSKGLSLLRLETEGDSYCAFIIPAENSKVAIELAVDAGLIIYDENDWDS